MHVDLQIHLKTGQTFKNLLVSIRRYFLFGKKMLVVVVVKDKEKSAKKYSEIRNSFSPVIFRPYGLTFERFSSGS